MGTRIVGLLAGATLLTTACGAGVGPIGEASSVDTGLQPGVTVPGGPSEGGGNEGGGSGILDGSMALEGDPGSGGGSGESTTPGEASSTTQASTGGGSGSTPTSAPSTTAPTATPSTTAPPTTPSTTAPPTTAPSTTPTTEPTTSTTAVPMVSVEVIFIRFQAIRDCDGIEGLGDFDFQAVLTGPNGGALLNSENRGVQLGDNEYVNNIQTAKFSVPAVDGQQFRVDFIAREWDQPIGAPARGDDRMDNATTARVHELKGGTWTGNNPTLTGLGGTYPTAIQLSVGSDNCIAEFQYRIETT